LQDQSQDFIHPIQYLIILKTDDIVSLRFQKLCSAIVICHLFICRVRSSIDLNNQSLLATNKVSNVWPNWNLPGKPEAFQGSISQLLPQTLLSERFILSQIPRRIDLGTLSQNILYFETQGSVTSLRSPAFTSTSFSPMRASPLKART